MRRSSQAETAADVRPLKSELARMETSLRAEIAKVKARMTMRTIVIVGSLDAVLFVLLKFT